MVEEGHDNKISPTCGLTYIKDLIEKHLPDGNDFVLVHIRSPPQKCRKLVFTSSSDQRLDSMTTHYFLIIHENVAIISLELYTFESPDTFTIFISKADTTGHYNGPKLQTMTVMQDLIRAIIRYYSPIGKRIQICLFAKAEGQYLFLGSIRNPRKHILSDAQLVKWWICCLDGLHSEFTGFKEGKCTLNIPGISDERGIATYFPPSPVIPWKGGDIFWQTEQKEEDNLTMAVKRIPRFPDDPKSRFLDNIVAERRAKTVTRQQFWLELQSRQEFLLGKSVGIIGLESWAKKDICHSCVKEPTNSKRDCDRFKELLISLNFESMESSIEATEKLLKSIPDSCKISLQGTGKYSNECSTNKRKLEDTITVNTLGGGMIRKKRQSELV